MTSRKARGSTYSMFGFSVLAIILLEAITDVAILFFSSSLPWWVSGPSESFLWFRYAFRMELIITPLLFILLGAYYLISGSGGRTRVRE
ncbi:MAG: hypothetical protein M0Z77_08065 [Thermoplasmatales archaeon]|nr:hypothetical protein [Thermoplasmatales archaeon]